MSPKPKCHQNANVIKMQMSPKPKCHQNANATKMPHHLFPFLFSRNPFLSNSWIDWTLHEVGLRLCSLPSNCVKVDDKKIFQICFGLSEEKEYPPWFAVLFNWIEFLNRIC